MKKSYTVPPCSGKSFDLKKGQTVTVIDTFGKQVVDFFAENLYDSNEFLSTGVTIDCNEKLKLKKGDYVYTNLYGKMFFIAEDSVEEHDLLHPCCRPEMYDFFYRNGKEHANCLDNINACMNSERPVIHPVNLFMNTQINSDGTITVKKPLSNAGDKIVLKALMDVRIGLAACSVSESDCNGGNCTSVEVIIE